MATDQWKIRLVRQAGNDALTHLLSKVLIKLNVPKQGTVFTDPEFDSIFDSFLLDNLNYSVDGLGKHIMGVAGIAPLLEDPSGYWELQKMYFLVCLRRKSFGNQMTQKCLTKAKSCGFHIAINKPCQI